MITENSEKSLRINEMISALPDMGKTEKVSQEVLANISKRIARKKLPVSSLTRLWGLGSAQTKITMGYLAYWLRYGAPR